MRPDPLAGLVPSIVTGAAVLDMDEEPDAEMPDEHRGERGDRRDRRVSGEQPGGGEQDRQPERDEPEQAPLEPGAQPAHRDQGDQRTDREAAEGELGEQLEECSAWPVWASAPLLCSAERLTALADG